MLFWRLYFLKINVFEKFFQEFIRVSTSLDQDRRASSESKLFADDTIVGKELNDHFCRLLIALLNRKFHTSQI